MSNPARVQEQKQQTLNLLNLLNRADARDAAKIWPRFEDDYFLRHTPEELAWHLPAIARADDSTMPLLLVRGLTGSGTAVFLYTKDRDHLFGLTTGVLAQLGLNIIDARLNTTDDGYVLDSYAVVEENGTELDTDSFHEIQTALRSLIAAPSI